MHDRCARACSSLWAQFSRIRECACARASHSRHSETCVRARKSLSHSLFNCFSCPYLCIVLHESLSPRSYTSGLSVKSLPHSLLLRARTAVYVRIYTSALSVKSLPHSLLLRARTRARARRSISNDLCVCVCVCVCVCLSVCVCSQVDRPRDGNVTGSNRLSGHVPKLTRPGHAPITRLRVPRHEASHAPPVTCLDFGVDRPHSLQVVDLPWRVCV